MSLFRKKSEHWWQKGHATGSKMSQVEKCLHDNWLAYHYDSTEDYFYVSIQRMETGNHRLNCVISHPGCNKVRITSYTALPLISEADEELREKFAQIKALSEFTNMQVERKYGFVVCTYEFDTKSDKEWLPYIMPVMIEHARIIDENYDDIRSSYPNGKYIIYPAFALVPGLRPFQDITLNKICRIFNETAIVHHKAKNE